MLENLSDDVGLVCLDEGDDLHGSAATWAEERVGELILFRQDGGHKQRPLCTVLPVLGPDHEHVVKPPAGMWDGHG